MPKKTFLDEIEDEVGKSNIRLSSNDDICYAVDIIDKLIKRLALYEKKHPDNCYCIFCG